MDVVWGLAGSDKTDDEIHLIACAKFIDRWIEEGFPYPMQPEDATFLKNKTPGVAAEMLFNYIKKRRPLINTGKVTLETKFFLFVRTSRVSANNPSLLDIAVLSTIFRTKMA